MAIEKLHGATNSLASKIFLGVIAVAFVLSGVTGYVFTRTDTSAAKVNGDEISQQTFLQRYNVEFENLSNLLGARFDSVSNTPEFVAELRQRVLNNLIDQTLLRQYADELKLDTSDERIKQEIVTSEMFQTDGKFDNALYQRMLQLNGMSSDTYGGYVREAVRLEQLQQGLANTAFIIPAKKQQAAELMLQTRQVRLAKFPLEQAMEKQTVTDEEVQAYYDNNKAAFAVPQLVKVQYIELTKADVEKQIEVSDVEIAQFYQDNKALYLFQAEQRLSHIEVATEKEAQDLYQALQTGANFADLAKKHSLDKISAQQGGDLSWSSAGAFPKVFEEAANSLTVGQYSQPVKVDNHYHIILVTDRKAPTALPLEEVKTQIAEHIRQNLVNNQYYSIEKQIAEKAFEHPESLAKAAEVAGLSIQETDYFPAADVPEKLNFPNVIGAIFNSDIAQGAVNSEPMNVGEQHAVVVRVIEQKPEGIKPFEDVKAQIATYLKTQKAENEVFAEVNALAQKLAQDPQAQLPQGVSFGEQTDWVWALNKNTDPQLSQVIFALPHPTEQPVYQASKNDRGEVVLIELNKVVAGQLADEAMDTAFKAELERVSQRDIQVKLLTALRAKAKIEVNERFMNQGAE